MITKTKIDWCHYTWNPVWGCLNDCSYCYARKIAKRFSDPAFIPTWKQKNFNKPFPKKPSRIFVNSMSDICWWKSRWMDTVLDKIKNHPSHVFQFLTKQSIIYSLYNFPINCWLGMTATANRDLTGQYISSSNCKYVSLEPLLERINPDLLSVIGFDWVIIGAETGNRKNKVIPEREWIAAIVDYCNAVNIPVFLKDSLRKIWGKELIQEFPRGSHD